MSVVLCVFIDSEKASLKVLVSILAKSLNGEIFL